MYKIAFASGKGGAGKTSIATALYQSLAEYSIMIDCDVDASNCFILLERKITVEKPFISGRKYIISPELCTGCGTCVSFCQFDAIYKNVNTGKYAIKNFGCEGCGACTDVCTADAITFNENHCGTLYAAESIYNTPLYYAKLKPGEDNSGKLINELKRIAYENDSYTHAIIDAPPGTGCPVISSLSGIDMLVIVIEATQSGYTDALKLLELVKHKKMKVIALINKAGINAPLEKIIIEKLEADSIPVVGKISFNKEFYRLLGEKKMITETEDPFIKKEIDDVINKIKELMK